MKEPHMTTYKIRGILMAPPFLFLLVTFVGETEWDSLIWPIGLAFSGLGVLLRVWAQMHLHYRLRISKTLTTTGPYAYLRNPIYVANTTMLLGLTVMSELLWFLPLMLVWCMAVYSLVVRREEAHLSHKYGQPYRDYMHDVPRWFPRIGGHRRPCDTSIRARSFLWQSILAELHCALWLIPLIGKEALSRMSF